MKMKSKQPVHLKQIEHPTSTQVLDKEEIKKSSAVRGSIYNKRVSGKRLIPAVRSGIAGAQSKAKIIKELENKIESHLIINELLKISCLPIKTLSEVFEMTPKTLSSYKTPGRYLPTRIVELIIQIKGLYTKGIEIFGSADNFNIWLTTEAFGLNNTKPIKLFNSSTGIELIYEELVRIEFGATA
jgi:uncharacterized protein (DUF2384 family)